MFCNSTLNTLIIAVTSKSLLWKAVVRACNKLTRKHSIRTALGHVFLLLNYHILCECYLACLHVTSFNVRCLAAGL